MNAVRHRLYRFTYAYRLPRTDLDGFEIEVIETNEAAAAYEARRRADAVTTRIKLELVSTTETQAWRSW